MKITTAIIFISATLFWACDNQNSNDGQQAVDRLESYVDSVETELSTDAKHDWASIEAEYKKLKVDAENAVEEAVGEEQTAVDKLGDRYEKAKAEAEMRAEQFNAQTEKHLDRADNWFERAADNMKSGAENIGEETEEGFQESMNWLEKNYEKLEDSAKQEYDKLKAKSENNKS
ncbi:MAG: hypothetical protein ABR572_10580 [Cryomorphaceae bacterium]|nr:hypothetical protein [Flavobacteriales bacterium]